MSRLVNQAESPHIEMTQSLFVDVLKNEALDMAVLIYREYFMYLRKDPSEIITILIAAFEKPNGMLESKCYLIRRYLKDLTYAQANHLLEVIETRVYDKSKSNILIRTLNVVKAACILIEVIERVKQRFGFLSRRVLEVRNKIIKVCVQFMEGVKSEEEMRFYLVELDLDERDSLMHIYTYDIVELIEHPFC